MSQPALTGAHLTRRGFFKTSAAAAQARSARQRPNILFLFPDQHRHDWIGGQGDLPVRTPHLDRLASMGMRFTRAVTPSPLCAPARACLAAGKVYDRCGVRDNGVDFPLEQRTYYQLLRAAGYYVIGCGKFDLHKATRDWGLDGRRLLPEWGFSDGIDNAGKIDAIQSGQIEAKDPYMAYLHQRGLAAAHVDDMQRRMAGGSYLFTGPTPLPEEAYCDNWVAQNGLNLLREAPRHKPWHLMVNFTGPHNPLDITRRMDRICRNRSFPEPHRSRQHTPQAHNAIRQNYSAMVENIDRWVGIYLEELNRRGELDNTLVVYSSDHGEMLGDHERWGKTLPYQPSIGVPLIVAGPGVRRGITSDALVSIMDLAATYLDYAGLHRPADMDSRSLRPVLEGRCEEHREHVLSGLGSWRCVFDGRFKLVRGFDPTVQKRQLAPRHTPPILWDLKMDPAEDFNLAQEAPTEVDRLTRLL